MPPTGPVPENPSIVSRVTALVPGVAQRRNKAAMLQMTEAFNAQKPDIAPKLLHPDARPDKSMGEFALQPELGKMPIAQRIRSEIALVHDAFENAKYTVKDLVAEGDTAILVWEFTGTHKGEFFGKRATGRDVNVMGFEVVKFKNGKMFQHYDNHPQSTVDVLGQLGLLDAPTVDVMFAGG